MRKKAIELLKTVPRTFFFFFIPYLRTILKRESNDENAILAAEVLDTMLFEHKMLLEEQLLEAQEAEWISDRSGTNTAVTTKPQGTFPVRTKQWLPRPRHTSGQ
jgi:hypothetical protein